MQQAVSRYECYEELVHLLVSWCTCWCRCSKVYMEDGPRDFLEFEKDALVSSVIEMLALETLRIICLAYRVINDDGNEHALLFSIVASLILSWFLWLLII